MKVAIVHYWLITYRGGEKVIESILKLFPNADIYTLFYDEELYAGNLNNSKVYASVLNKSSFLRKHYQKIFPLYPYGINSLELKDTYDLIISSESGPAKGIKIPDGTPHICYIHSPMRYCWGFTQDYLNSMPKFARPLAAYFFKNLKAWDKTTVNNVTHYVANSYNVADRVQKYYNRNASVIHPPISLDLFKNNLEERTKDVYLSFGAITPYKRVDLLVDAFNQSGKELIIIGNGSEKEKLEGKAKENIKFYGNLDWNEIEIIFLKTKALLFPGEEDFGMIPLEVMAFGIPVLAFNKGGALETVVENNEDISESSGLFFTEQSTSAILECIDKFERIETHFDNQWIRNHARKFGEDYFLNSFDSFVKEKMNN